MTGGGFGLTGLHGSAGAAGTIGKEQSRKCWTCKGNTFFALVADTQIVTIAGKQWRLGLQGGAVVWHSLDPEDRENQKEREKHLDRSKRVDI